MKIFSENSDFNNNKESPLDAIMTSLPSSNSLVIKGMDRVACPKPQFKTANNILVCFILKNLNLAPQFYVKLSEFKIK